MISPEMRAQIRRYFYAEHWKIGTIARQLDIHPDTVRSAIHTQRLGGAQIVRPSMVDPYLAFIRETLEQYPRLRATRIYQMARHRGYTGTLVQFRRAVSRVERQGTGGRRDGGDCVRGVAVARYRLGQHDPKLHQPAESARAGTDPDVLRRRLAVQVTDSRSNLVIWSSGYLVIDLVIERSNDFQSIDQMAR